MLEPVTYSVSELAQRWNVTPRQILDMALQLRVPLYFNFDGLVFEITDDWHRHAGDSREAEKLEALQADIERNNAWLARRARGETDEYDYLSDEDARELREAITNNQQEVETLKDKLEARERERRHAHYLGAIRPPAETLREIQRDGESDTPHWGYHPESAIKVVHIPARKYGGAGGLVGEGHLLALEPYLTPWRKLTADSLFAMTAEVKTIEAHQHSKAEPEKFPAPKGDTAPAAAPQGIQWELTATPGELVQAFGLQTGIEVKWFADRPKLQATKAAPGKTGKSGYAAQYYVFQVMQYLLTKPRGARPITERRAWELLRANFPKVYAAHESVSPID